jgi:hypothetical protein
VSVAVQPDQNDVEIWRRELEQHHYQLLVDSGSTHRNAVRLSRQRADLELEAEIATVAIRRYSFGAEARERELWEDGSEATRYCLEIDQKKGVKGKGGRSSGRRRKKPVPYTPGSKLGKSAA